MVPRIDIINGPNLNLLGQREPEIYGHETLAGIEATCRALAERIGLELRFFQSNHEGALVDRIQAARGHAAGIVINPAAYTHTSVAILDALSSFDGPVIELHLSNVHRREAFRHHSYVSSRADAVIAGCGAQGYELALWRMARLLGRA
ncbi:MAG: type II 3-dehydroquinate dehydratase [Pararhodobacter sp.]|nr:type II 3-dehydroquinate dehydratase [Pararhodobacter sp.]